MTSGEKVADWLGPGAGEGDGAERYRKRRRDTSDCMPLPKCVEGSERLTRLRTRAAHCYHRVLTTPMRMTQYAANAWPTSSHARPLRVLLRSASVLRARMASSSSRIAEASIDREDSSTLSVLSSVRQGKMN